MTDETKKQLSCLALSAMKNAYAPYSGFKVGAALLTSDGKIFTGCNIENSAFTPTCCAERTAFFKAVSEGYRDFEAIALCGGKNGEAKGEIYPCGVCLQVMTEFCDPRGFSVFFVTEENISEKKLCELLPFSFGKEKLC